MLVDPTMMSAMAMFRQLPCRDYFSSADKPEPQRWTLCLSVAQGSIVYCRDHGETA